MKKKTFKSWDDGLVPLLYRTLALSVRWPVQWCWAASLSMQQQLVVNCAPKVKRRKRGEYWEYFFFAIGRAAGTFEGARRGEERELISQHTRCGNTKIKGNNGKLSQQKKKKDRPPLRKKSWEDMEVMVEINLQRIYQIEIHKARHSRVCHRRHLSSLAFWYLQGSPFVTYCNTFNLTKTKPW